MKEQKGISLIVLVITIIVMLIIAGAVISAGVGNLETKNLMSMYTDLKSLNDKIAVYYNKYGTIPLGERFMGAYDFNVVANPNDDEDGYYVININRLDKLVLTKKLTWEENDVYIINTKTHTLYYPEGVELDGEMYYRLPGEYSKLDISVNQEIQMSASSVGEITAGDVTVTIVWPEVGETVIKQVKVGNEEWQTVTGDMNKVIITKNTTVLARTTNGNKEINTAKITINNIDKNAPMVKAVKQTQTIDWGTTQDLSKYFEVTANGKAEISEITYINVTNGNEVIENTNTLEVGTYTIQCIATKKTGQTARAAITLVVEPGVYGNLYKISDTEYHLIFNGTGAIAEGYTESQLVAKGTNIKYGSGYTTNSEGENISNQPWGPYSENITKVKIEEEIKPRSTEHYFRNLSQIIEIEGINNIDTSNTISMVSMFDACGSLMSIEIGSWNTGIVTNMCNMFWGCSSLSNVGVSNWNTNNLTNMKNLFCGCSSLTSVDVSDWDTSNVTNMQGMFNGCSSLTSVDVSDWDTSNVTNMQVIFNGCSSLSNVDVSKWNTSNVTNMLNLFCGASNLASVDVSKWNTKKVENMQGIFSRCYKLESIDLSNWNPSKAVDMDYMFDRCTGLTKIYVGDDWNTDSVSSSVSMFYNCTALSGIISYDVNKLDATYANYINGYLTRKIAKNCIYFEDFNDNAYSNYTYENATVVLSSESVLKCSSTSWDPKIIINLSTNQYFNPKEYRYLYVKYKLTANINTMEFFMVPKPTDQTYSISQRIITDGQWHTATFDLSTNSSVWGLSEITGIRFDPIDNDGVTIEIDYIGISSTNE